MIIGEHPTNEDSFKQEPFTGYAGKLLDKLLLSVGFLRTSSYLAYACHHRPPNDDIGEWVSNRKTCPGPDWVQYRGKWVHRNVAEGISRLEQEIERVSPKLIITLGNLPLWALTGNTGALKWRGSRLCPPDREFTVVPSLSLASAVKQEEMQSIIQMDFRRAKAIYEGTQNPRLYKFIVAPTFEQTASGLSELFDKANAAYRENRTLRLAGDLETRLGHIACFGIAWSAEEALCIPFLQAQGRDQPRSVGAFYWTEDQETYIVSQICQLFTHPGISWDGQNYLYDCQYFWRFWGTLPRNVFDTMIGHHSIHSNLRKGLDFLSSMYAQDHIYWKDESKDWDVDLGEKQLWTYNCKDCCITWEISPEIQNAQFEQANEGGYSVANVEHHNFQQSLFFPVLRMMNRGIRLDTTQRDRLRKELTEAAVDRQFKLEYMAGHELNPRSALQLKKFFYDDLGLPVIHALNSDSITTNSPAMAEIARRFPPLSLICQTITELRSIGVFLSTFVNAELDSDARMRCSFAVAGPTTFRFSSSENAFGSGMNLQNIPVAEKEKIKAKDYIKLPNIRKLFIPDPGFTFFDMDLDRADLQVVVWEADDADMKLALRENLDMHCVNACTIFDIKGIPFDELKETHPNYNDHRAKIGKPLRDKAKIGVHATNYGVGDNKLAISLGITRNEASRFRSRWFAAHPGIHKWHKRTEDSVAKRGFIENPFGARLYKLGRFDLPEFLGWLPQSTVAGVINRALVKIDAAEQAGQSRIQLLIQVHDSLAGQFPTASGTQAIAQLQELGKVAIPYPDPLVIPVGIKTSPVSWGDCK